MSNEMTELDKSIILASQMLNLGDILKYKKLVKPLFIDLVSYAERNLAKQIFDSEITKVVVEDVAEETD